MLWLTPSSIRWCFDRRADTRRPGRQSDGNDSTGPGIAGNRAAPAWRVRGPARGSSSNDSHDSTVSRRGAGHRPQAGSTAVVADRMSAFRPPARAPSSGRTLAYGRRGCHLQRTASRRSARRARQAIVATVTPRSGSATSYVAASRATRRRDVADAPTTRSRLTCRTVHAPVAHDLSSQSSLAVEAMDRRLRVGDDGLDLDDEQRFAGSRDERQDVDRAALAPDRERDLDLDDPVLAVVSAATIASTTAAWSSSTSRSSCSPRQRSRTSTSAPSTVGSSNQRAAA